MTLFYFLMLTFVALVAFAGYDATMRLVQFIDLQIRYAGIRVQMKWICLLYTSPSPRDSRKSRMPSSA